MAVGELLNHFGQSLDGERRILCVVWVWGDAEVVRTPNVIEDGGVSGEVPKYVDGFVETAIGMELSG